ncbi:MAG: hypothetical protein ACI8TE_000654 [Francisella sp.]|jgi:hypothetical protein
MVPTYKTKLHEHYIDCMLSREVGNDPRPRSVNANYKEAGYSLGVHEKDGVEVDLKEDSATWTCSKDFFMPEGFYTDDYSGSNNISLGYYSKFVVSPDYGYAGDKNGYDGMKEVYLITLDSKANELQSTIEELRNVRMLPYNNTKLTALCLPEEQLDFVTTFFDKV